MENEIIDPIDADRTPNRPADVLKWAEQVSEEYEICLIRGLLDVKKSYSDDYVKSPLGGDYNHIIAVVFSNVLINNKETEFFLDQNGLHFYDYPFKLKTREYGFQIHTVYRSEHEALAWVETRAFHKGNTYYHTRYILGSEQPAYFEGQDGFEDIYHG